MQKPLFIELQRQGGGQVLVNLDQIAIVAYGEELVYITVIGLSETLVVEKRSFEYVFGSLTDGPRYCGGNPQAAYHRMRD